MTLRTVRRLAAAAAAVVLVATGCTDDGDETPAGTTATTGDTSPTTVGPTGAPTTDSPEATSTASSVATTGPRSDTGDESADELAGAGLGDPPARVDVALDATELADQLSASHATIVDPTASVDEREDAGTAYQLLLRELAGRPELDEEVLAGLDPAARPAVERIVRARQFLQARSESRPPQPPPDELPAWTIAEPEPIETLLGHYAEAEQLTGVGWNWLAAIHLQETRMGRIQGVSSAGAVGPMQFLPTTWATCCTGDPTVTRDAIIGAATYLAQSGGPDDMAAALYQYNPNDGYVAVVTAYAESLRDEPELYSGYHAFQVFFGSSAGTVRLPIGYSLTSPIDAAAYLESNPQDAA